MHHYTKYDLSKFKYKYMYSVTTEMTNFLLLKTIKKRKLDEPRTSTFSLKLL